jgi:hypothetical protein
MNFVKQNRNLKIKDSETSCCGGSDVIMTYNDCLDKQELLWFCPLNVFPFFFFFLIFIFQSGSFTGKGHVFFAEEVNSEIGWFG